MKKIGVCGHFGIGLDLLNGQTVKTKIITEELKRQLGEDQVAIVDTHGGAKRVPGMCLDTFRLFKECESIMILPAHKGLKLFVPMCSLYNKFFHRKLYYCVIGGWLDGMLKKNPYLVRGLKKFTSICVETSTMKKSLLKHDLRNVSIFRNCKSLKQLDPSVMQTEYTLPYRLCTFSTVMEEKGIEDIIKAVETVNSKAGKTVYKLDIYGNIHSSYKEAFQEILTNTSECINYTGAVPYDKSVETLRDYFALVFPTRFYTEGIPGTVIDAYASGLPVISAKWESYSDVIEEGITGLGYEFRNTDGLVKLLEDIAKDPSLIISKKQACLKKSKEFMPDYVISQFIKNQMIEE